MAATEPLRPLTYDEEWKIISDAVEASAAKKPDWLHLAKSAWPELYWQARLLKQGLEKNEASVDAVAKDKTTIEEKWKAVEALLRDTKPEAMTALDALQEHVNTWTICDPATMASLLKGASTEQERFDVILGTRIQALMEKARETFTDLEVRHAVPTSGLKAQTRPRPDGSGDDSDDSVTFVTTPLTISKSARKRAQKKRNKAKQTAEEALRKEHCDSNNNGNTGQDVS